MEMILFLDNLIKKRIHNNFNLFNICYYINRIDYRCILSDSKNPESEKIVRL
jgi:hypothetical protein